MDKEPLVDLEKPMDTPMAKEERLKKEDNKEVVYPVYPNACVASLWSRQSKTKSIRVEREVFGTVEEHLILVPPNEPMLLFTGGWLDSSILEWFAMSLRKWTAEKGHPKCKYMAPRLIEERRCRKESTELKNYLMDAIDHNDDKCI
ncbi:hypothetical protein Tco_1457575 [Tanacetum coccineum]